jgi:thiosulfate/3-mercaptopyruvate sulfurtransferase
VIIDVRPDAKNFYAQPIIQLDKKTGKQQLIKVGGHIPGARHIPYNNIRTTRIINGLKINNLIPAKEQFEALLQKAGVNANSQIVIVTNAEDGSDLNAAARMYWQIKYYGHDDLAILDGGMAQWILEGREVHNQIAEYESGDWRATRQRDELLATSEEVAQAIENNDIQIIDVRPLSQYLGVNNTKGHIPTAKYFPVEFISSGRLPVKFVTKPELSELAHAFNANTKGEVITYCNSGHMASGSWFVMHALLGNQMTALYDGSMTQWNAEKRPTVRMQLQ